MELNLNVFDYLSEEDVKEVIKSEVASCARESVKEMFRDEESIRRILCNTAYTNIEMEVEKLIPNYKDAIAQDVKNVIDKQDLKYEVFHDDYGYGKCSLGTKYLNEAITNSKDTIKERVEKTISEYDVKKLIQETFRNKFGELADSFGNIADMLYSISQDKE